MKTDSYYGVFANHTDGFTYSEEAFLGFFSSLEKASIVALKNMRERYQDHIWPDGEIKKRLKLEDTIYTFVWEDSVLRVFSNEILMDDGNDCEIKIITVDEER